MTTESHDDCILPELLDEADQADGRAALAGMLEEIQLHDTDYDNRNKIVLFAVATAALVGMEAGIQVDPAEPGYVVACIELPTGAVGWHIPVHAKPYDGHTTEQKYARVGEFIKQQEAAL